MHYELRGNMPRSGRASPKGYAQLLLPSSLNRCRPLALADFCQRTCVGLRYGKKVLPNEIFLESRTTCVALPLRVGLPITSQLNVTNGFSGYHYLEA